MHIPIIEVSELADKVGPIAAEFYDHPSLELQVFGFTGTNGKTTSTWLLAQALGALGSKVGVIGTLGVGTIGRDAEDTFVVNDLSTSGYTTPDAVNIQRQLRSWSEDGIDTVCMEVSSHALHQGRVAGVQFFASAFINLSHDHLDYHHDMHSYASAKMRLFTEFATTLSVINIDYKLGRQLVDAAHSEFVCSFGERRQADICIEHVEVETEGIKIEFAAQDLTFKVSSKLVGRVNTENIALVVAFLLSLGVEIREISEIVSQLSAPSGRMEVHRRAGKCNVVIDFAHTPDALEKALTSIGEHCLGDVWCVFGCGGDRDQAKRPIMGSIAKNFASFVIVTSDNPRSETPEAIAEEILQGVGTTDHVDVILDRAKAINSAIKRARSDDWVLIAGKRSRNNPRY